MATSPYQKYESVAVTRQANQVTKKGRCGMGAGASNGFHPRRGSWLGFRQQQHRLDGWRRCRMDVRAALVCVSRVQLRGLRHT